MHKTSAVASVEKFFEKIVIGCGISGLAEALHHVLEGLNTIAILEANPIPYAGSSEIWGQNHIGPEYASHLESGKACLLSAIFNLIVLPSEFFILTKPTKFVITQLTQTEGKVTPEILRTNIESLSEFASLIFKSLEKMCRTPTLKAKIKWAKHLLLGTGKSLHRLLHPSELAKIPQAEFGIEVSQFEVKGRALLDHIAQFLQTHGVLILTEEKATQVKHIFGRFTIDTQQNHHFTSHQKPSVADGLSQGNPGQIDTFRRGVVFMYFESPPNITTTFLIEGQHGLMIEVTDNPHLFKVCVPSESGTHLAKQRLATPGNRFETFPNWDTLPAEDTVISTLKQRLKETFPTVSLQDINPTAAIFEDALLNELGTHQTLVFGNPTPAQGPIRSHWQDGSAPTQNACQLLLPNMIGLCAAVKLNGKTLIQNGHLYHTQLIDDALVTTTYTDKDTFLSPFIQAARLHNATPHTFDTPQSFEALRTHLNTAHPIDTQTHPIPLQFTGQAQKIQGQVFIGHNQEKKVIEFNNCQFTGVGFRNPPAMESRLTKASEWYHLHTLVTTAEGEKHVIHILDMEGFTGTMSVGEPTSRLSEL